MIFVTVGTQLPFDRLIQLVDQFAGRVDVEVTGQIGTGVYLPKNIKWQRFYEPDELDSAFSNASVVVSHAGMGSIINCIRLEKPIILFPRLASLAEHRNDHQLDTLRSFSAVQGIYPAKNESELNSLLKDFESLSPPKGLESPDRVMLCDYIKAQL